MPLSPALGGCVLWLGDLGDIGHCSRLIAALFATIRCRPSSRSYVLFRAGLVVVGKGGYEANESTKQGS